ncbi:MAG: hypothetical protein K6E98_12015, partial [Lachnospiraceae bacterium]|nr:hypothetical protein [Lachnospiraceae bacterium]
MIKKEFVKKSTALVVTGALSIAMTATVFAAPVGNFGSSNNMRSNSSQGMQRQMSSGSRMQGGIQGMKRGTSFSNQKSSDGEQPSFENENMPQMAEGEQPSFENGNMPQMTDGEQPSFENGNMPQMTEGEQPSFENGNMPQMTEGGQPSFENGNMPQMT